MNTAAKNFGEIAMKAIEVMKEGQELKAKIRNKKSEEILTKYMDDVNHIIVGLISAHAGMAKDNSEKWDELVLKFDSLTYPSDIETSEQVIH